MSTSTFDVIREGIPGNDPLDLNELLSRPLMAHLSTASAFGPRESPVWFLWEDSALWIIGTHADSFPRRVAADPNCAVGIADFAPESGRLHHAGLRGTATVVAFDAQRARRKLAKYLGENEARWDPRLASFLTRPDALLVRFTPETIVLRNQSYTPNTARPGPMPPAT